MSCDSQQLHTNDLRDHVAGDLPCARCDYNLNTLPITGICPECELPISESLRPDRLIFADQHWLNSIKRGIVLISIALGLILFVSFPLRLPQLFLILIGSRHFDHPLLHQLVNIAEYTLMPAWVLLPVGAFFVLRAEPDHPSLRKDRYTEQLRRHTLFWVILVLLAFVLPGIVLRMFWLPASLELIVYLMHTAVGFLASGMMGMMFFWYVATLARRALAPQLDRLLTRLSFGALLIPMIMGAIRTISYIEFPIEWDAWLRETHSVGSLRISRTWNLLTALDAMLFVTFMLGLIAALRDRQFKRALFQANVSRAAVHPTAPEQHH